MHFQLILIRETNEFEEAINEQYTLRDLQNMLINFGPNHFNPKGNNPIHYVQVLLLSAQFERVRYFTRVSLSIFDSCVMRVSPLLQFTRQAVDYLYSSQQYNIEAVHIAIALAYYGVLRISSDPLMADVQLCRLTRTCFYLIGRYTF